MAAKRDYYEVLGVSKNATDDEIKRAYRKKAKECHPDLHPDDKSAVERFKELNEANEVLSDPDKRARYDQFGFEDPMSGMGGGGNPFGGFDFGGMGDIFDQLFNGGMGGRTTRSQGPVQGNDLRYELRITFPLPPHAGHVRTVVIHPPFWRICPAPLQFGQVTGDVPGFAPVPLQVSQSSFL